MASNSSGTLTFLANSNSVRSSLNNGLERQKLSGSVLIEMNQNGGIVQQKPTRRDIKRLFYNQADELFALVKNSTDSNATYKLCRVDEKLNLTDSTNIITLFRSSGIKDDWEDPRIIFNQSFVGFITKVKGFYQQDGPKKSGSGYFIGWMAYSQSGGFLKLFTHFVDRDPFVIENENPQVAFNGQYLAAIHKGNDDSLYLYNYSLQTPIDSVLIPSNIYSMSIANTIGSEKLYALVSFKQDFDWKGTWQFTGKDRMVMFSLNEQLDITNSIHKPLTYKILKGSRTAQSGLALFGGYNSLMFPLEQVHPDKSVLGYIEIDSSLSRLNSTLFEATIAPHGSKYGDIRQSILLPYRDGVYQIFPDLIWRNAAPQTLKFENSPLLTTQFKVNVQNLLLHSTERTFSLTSESDCKSLMLQVTGPTDLIREVAWTINGSPKSETGSTFEDFPAKDGWVKACATITQKTGLTEQVCDSFYFGSSLVPGITMVTSVECQWKSVEFESKTQFNGIGVKKHIWEFWKNDTVFISDTTEKPTVVFTKPGTYTLKYYADDGVCKKGITLPDTITIKPATKAQILNFPFPVCAGSQVELRAKPYTNTQQTFKWFDGEESQNQSSRTITSDRFQWVTLTALSNNGCETQDSIFFRTRASGIFAVDSVLTQQDFTPLFYMSSTGFPKFRFERNDGSSGQTGWQKPTHRDVSIDLREFEDGYSFYGIDSCGNESNPELWYPLVLTLSESGDRLEARTSRLGWQQLWAKRGDGDWVKLNTDPESLWLDTLTDVYQFKYRSFNSGSWKTAISNTVEVAPQNQFFLPNAFSPNGDGINDIFSGVKPKNTEIESIQVFARNGQLVQYTSNIESIWDGTVKGLEAPVGSYTYIVNYQQNGESKSLSGGVMLVK